VPKELLNRLLLSMVYVRAYLLGQHKLYLLGSVVILDFGVARPDAFRSLVLVGAAVLVEV